MLEANAARISDMYPNLSPFNAFHMMFTRGILNISKGIICVASTHTEPVYGILVQMLGRSDAVAMLDAL